MQNEKNNSQRYKRKFTQEFKDGQGTYTYTYYEYDKNYSPFSDEDDFIRQARAKRVQEQLNRDFNEFESAKNYSNFANAGNGQKRSEYQARYREYSGTGPKGTYFTNPKKSPGQSQWTYDHQNKTNYMGKRFKDAGLNTGKAFDYYKSQYLKMKTKSEYQSQKKSGGRDSQGFQFQGQNSSQGQDLELSPFDKVKSSVMYGLLGVFIFSIFARHFQEKREYDEFIKARDLEIKRKAAIAGIHAASSGDR